MDKDPLSRSSEEPESPLSDGAKSDRTKSDETKSLLLSSPPLPSPTNRNVFIGRKGIFRGAFWLIYLAMAWFVFQVEGWLVASLRSDLNLLWWRLTIEGCLMLAAILPGFVMARIESRPFGDFGLPAGRALRRNFWVGTLWGIASLSVLMLVLRAAGAFQFGSLSLHGVRIFKFAVYYAVLFLCTGFFEEFLVGGGSFVGCIRLHPRRESWRIEDWPGGGGIDRLVFMSHAAADRRFVGGRRVSRGLGLGRGLFLLPSRQR